MPDGIFINFILPTTPQKPIDKEHFSYMKNISLFVLPFLLCVFLGNAQETVIKHTVSKGETVFQLSRKYNVTPEEIYALNPSAVTVIKIDEVLSIPKNESTVSRTSSTDATTDSNILTYAVLYGDTKYSLARRYGISVEELERQNPHIKSELQAGHILKIRTQQNSSSLRTDFTIKKTHLVLKGETLWGISKENDLTVEQLVNANANSLSGILQIDQVLKIPNPDKGLDSNPKDTYVVKKGDTKYGLSKKYEVTIDELEKTNPQIVRMLMTGQMIRIPNSINLVANESSNEAIKTEGEIRGIKTTKDSITLDSSNNEKAEVTKNDEVVKETDSVVESDVDTKPEISGTKSFLAYEIQPQETLYGLSKKANMSISDFVSLNPELANGAKIGMIIKMPSENSNQTSVDEISVTAGSVKVDLTQTIKTSKRNQILLFLPFSESEFDTNYKQKISFNDLSDDFLREHLEFYRGSKIAQDSARALGLNFDIKIAETGHSKKNSKAVAAAEVYLVETYDAILLPFYENDTEEIATLVTNKNTPVITVGNTTNQKGLNNIYNSVPSVNSKRDVILDYINSKDGNLIVVCDIARSDSKAYISKYAPNARFIDVSKKGSFSESQLESLLVANTVNYVILESEKNSVFLSTTNILLGQLSKYDIQLALLDKSLLPNTNDVSQKRFVILQMLFPSLTPLIQTKESSHFVNSYKKEYGVEPSQNEKFGFDLTFDTLLRLSQTSNFETTIEKNMTEYTTLKFEYIKNEVGNHENKGIYILQYNSDASLKEVK